MLANTSDINIQNKTSLKKGIYKVQQKTNRDNKWDVMTQNGFCSDWFMGKFRCKR